jgi:RNA polymerase sigma factor (TIGR02999 family)
VKPPVEPEPPDVSEVLEAINAGDESAVDRLFPIVYRELRRLAGVAMAREKAGQTLQPTALVHEAWLRLVRSPNQSWNSRGHFFTAAAEAMRRILIERARRYGRQKRGDNPQRVELTEDAAIQMPRPEEWVALDHALDRLESHDAQMANVVKLRFFAGFTAEEIASALGMSPRSVDRAWAESRAWLIRDMGRSADR